MLINLFKFFLVNQVDYIFIFISFIFQNTYKFFHELLHLLLLKKKKKKKNCHIYLSVNTMTYILHSLENPWK